MIITREGSEKNISKPVKTLDITIEQGGGRFRLTEYFGELKIHAVEGDSISVSGGNGVNEMCIGIKGEVPILKKAGLESKELCCATGCVRNARFEIIQTGSTWCGEHFEEIADDSEFSESDIKKLN